MNETISVLLVDDERDITSSLRAFLEREGFSVSVADDGQAALDQINDGLNVDVIVTDVLMPRLDGRSFLRALRNGDDWTPVILLTQVGEGQERSAALNEGADDYLNKPFDPNELVARIRAVLRRAKPGKPLTAASCLQAGTLTFDRTTRVVKLDGEDVAITPKALMLLEYLMTHPDEVHSRHHLLTTLWGFAHPTSTRAIDHRVAELRRVLNDDSASPSFIETVAGRGYRFCTVVTAA